MNKVDLHLHTLISDGTDSLEEIIENVRKAELDLFSVTDHDSIKAGIMIPPMLETIEPEQRTAFVRGIEFSCEDELGKYHILGYGYDPAVPGIAEVVAEGHMMRMRKTKARLEFLQKEFQFQFTEEEINELLSKDNPGKPHIANLMIQHGYAETIQDAIKSYINKREFRNEHVRPEDAIKGILKFIFNAVLGYILLFVISFFGEFVGLTIDLSVMNIIIAGLLGVPGVILITLASFLF